MEKAEGSCASFILEVLARGCVRRDGTNCSMKVMGSSPQLPSGCCKSGCSPFCFYSFSSLCSSQRLHFRAHCSSLQGTFLLVDRSVLPVTPYSVSFLFLNACIFTSQKPQSRVLEKVNAFVTRNGLCFWVCLYFYPFLMCFSHVETEPWVKRASL